MNTRRAPLDDWRVRSALIHAFNFEFVNDTLTGGRQPRITSYFSNSELAMHDGPAEGRVRTLLEPFAETLLPGALGQTEFVFATAFPLLPCCGGFSISVLFFGSANTAAVGRR